MLTKSSYPEQREDPKVLVELAQPEMRIIIDSLYHYAVMYEFKSVEEYESAAQAIDLADGFQTMVENLIKDFGEL